MWTPSLKKRIYEAQCHHVHASSMYIISTSCNNKNNYFIAHKSYVQVQLVQYSTTERNINRVSVIAGHLTSGLHASRLRRLQFLYMLYYM